MSELQPDDRVITRRPKTMDRSDGTPIQVPAGHGGVVWKTARYAISAQRRERRVWVILNPIEGVNYILESTPDFFEKVENLKRSIEGTVRFFRTESNNPPCICCPGGIHIHGMRVEVEPYDDLIHPGLKIDDVQSFIHDWLCRYRDAGIEGKRVRVTIELVP